MTVSDQESKFIWDYFDPGVFRDVELIISCGDLKASYLSFLVTMIPAPLLYVHGNHDKDYSRRPPLGCECIDGRVVDYRGIRILGLGGCKTPMPGLHEYTEEQMWQRFKKINPKIKKYDGIDILVSHAPAIGLGDGADLFHMGFEALRHIDDIYEPKIHFFGHRHLNGSPVSRENIFKYGETVMVNSTGYRIVDINRPS